MTDKEIENAVKGMDFYYGLKVLKMVEADLRRAIRDSLLTVRACTETAFSDPWEGKSAEGAIMSDLQEIRKSTRHYYRLKMILRRKYDKEIRKGQKMDGLITRRIGGINYLFPNI